MPLFLSDVYRDIYDKSKENLEANATLGTTAKEMGIEPNAKKPAPDKKAKGAAKMYRQAWLQEKLTQQNEKKKKGRGTKQASAKTESTGAETGSKPSAKKTGNKKRDDQQDLELVIEDLRNEQCWRDEEMLELRKEVEALREQNKILTSINKKEKCERQILEANKLKYTMMKELVECRGEIEA